MAEDSTRTLETEETAHFIVYDRRTGKVLAVHYVTALPGVHAPSEAVIIRRVRTCAAEAIGRRTTELGVLRTPHAPAISPGMRVDVATGTLRTGRRARPAGKRRPEDGTPPSGTSQSSSP
jgi:hypothetical protein